MAPPTRPPRASHATNPSLTAPKVGYGIVSLGPTSAGPTPEMIARHVVQALDAPDWKPPLLPVVATQLIGLSRRPSIDFNGISTLVSQDPTLAAQLMRRANSSVYGASGQVRSLRDAIMRLGLDGVRDLALEVALEMRVFKAPGFQPAADTLRRHAVATGSVCAMVSRYTAFPAPQAFLYGLLADVGLALGLGVVAECGRNASCPGLTGIWPTLWAIHERVSARVCGLWGLDAELCQVVGVHHALRVGNVIHPMAAMVLIAAQLTEELGAGIAAQMAERYGIIVPDAGMRFESARETLGLTPRQLDLVRAEGKKYIQSMGA